MASDAPLLIVVAGPARGQVAIVDRTITIGRDTSSALAFPISPSPAITASSSAIGRPLWFAISTAATAPW